MNSIFEHPVNDNRKDTEGKMKNREVNWKRLLVLVVVFCVGMIIQGNREIKEMQRTAIPMQEKAKRAESKLAVEKQELQKKVKVYQQENKKLVCQFKALDISFRLALNFCRTSYYLSANQYNHRCLTKKDIEKEGSRCEVLHHNLVFLAKKQIRLLKKYLANKNKCAVLMKKEILSCRKEAQKVLWREAFRTACSVYLSDPSITLPLPGYIKLFRKMAAPPYLLSIANTMGFSKKDAQKCIFHFKRHTWFYKVSY